MNVKAYYQEGSKLSVWHSNRKNKQRNVTHEESLEGGDTDVSINHWIRRERVFLPSIQIASFGTWWQSEIPPPTVCLVPPQIVKSVTCLDRSMDPTRTKMRALHLKFTFVLEAECLESAIFCCYFFAVYLIRCSFPRGLKVTYCTLLQHVKIFHSGTSSPISPGKMIRQFLISSPILGHELLDFFQGEF